MSTERSPRWVDLLLMNSNRHHRYDREKSRTFSESKSIIGIIVGARLLDEERPIADIAPGEWFSKCQNTDQTPTSRRIHAQR